MNQREGIIIERYRGASFWACEQFLWKHVQHLIGQHRRGEHLIIAQGGDAVEHIGVVGAILHSEITIHSSGRSTRW